jgi:hypothetical protein
MSLSLFNAPRALALVFAAGLLSGFGATAFAAPALAQAAPAEDPYGIGTSPVAPGTPDTGAVPPPAPGAVRADTARPAAPAPDTVPTLQMGRSTSDTVVPRAPRPRITRETTVNPMDVQRGSYRNPKKALFMSLVVPGLGQAYIGQSKFNYVRAALYFTADVTMGYLWYDYSVVKYDKKVKQYRAFADQHWRQASYEDKITEMVGTVTEQALFEQLNPSRANYCAAVQSDEGSGADLVSGCTRVWSQENADEINYTDFKTTYAGDVPGPATGARRAGFPGDVEFYEMIGRDQEFVFGWDDVAADPGRPVSASNPGFDLTDTSWVGVSANRDRYNSMRQTAKDYSRMQTWFLGGIVLNHIASAVDAAITARRHNRVLYEDGGARWYDKVNLDGGMAMDLGRPRTYLTAYLSF